MTDDEFSLSILHGNNIENVHCNLQFPDLVAQCGGLYENGRRRFIDLNTWSPDGGADLKGLGSVKEVLIWDSLKIPKA